VTLGPVEAHLACRGGESNVNGDRARIVGFAEADHRITNNLASLRGVVALSAQSANPTGWKWVVRLDETRTKVGTAYSRASAMRFVELAIEKLPEKTAPRTAAKNFRCRDGPHPSKTKQVPAFPQGVFLIFLLETCIDLRAFLSQRAGAIRNEGSETM
jgi:hypothetical protein